MNIYITGDTHGSMDNIQGFGKIKMFIREYPETKNDLFIIAGDVGLNYYGGDLDNTTKSRVNKMGPLFLCVHGNHERRPQTIKAYADDMEYKEKIFMGGKVLFQDRYPNILFAVEGEIFNFNGLDTLIVGGAYSVDKYYRLNTGSNWFEDEQPSTKIKRKVQRKLARRKHKIDAIITHTVPTTAMPVEDFLPGIDQTTVDNGTEEWLERILQNNKMKYWFAGHYHCDKIKETGRTNVQILYKNIIKFPKND